jgi:hypothetical protein
MEVVGATASIIGLIQISQNLVQLGFKVKGLVEKVVGGPLSGWVLLTGSLGSMEYYESSRSCWRNRVISGTDPRINRISPA